MIFPHHGWDFPMAGWGLPFGGWLTLVLFVLATVLVIWLLVTVLSRRDHRPGDEAEAILRARLARGEITPEEYEQTRRILGLR